MTIITKLIILVASASQTFACVYSAGYIVHDPFFGGTTGGSHAEIWEGPDKENMGDSPICEGPLDHVDQNGHYSVICTRPGYVFAIQQNLAHAWYGYGSASFQWDQDVGKTSQDCEGCNGKTGKCQQCVTREWETYVYC